MLKIIKETDTDLMIIERLQQLGWKCGAILLKFKIIAVKYKEMPKLTNQETIISSMEIM